MPIRVKIVTAYIISGVSMGDQAFNMGAGLFFLAVLVLMAKSRDLFKREDQAGYRSISSGLVILALTVLFRINFSAGMFDSLPFVNDPMVFKLLSWIGIISGVILLSSGISSWLPLSRQHRLLDSRRLRRMELVRQVAQLLRVESRTTELLSRTLGHMVENYDLAGGVVVARSSTGPRVISVMTGSEEMSSIRRLKTADLEPGFFAALQKNNLTIDSFLKDSGSLSVSMPKSISMPQLIQPVMVHGEPVAAFLLWPSEGQSVDDEEGANFKIVAEMVAQKITVNYDNRINEQDDELKRQRDDLQKAVLVHDSLKESMVAIAESLCRSFSASFVSLALPISESRVERFSVGDNSTLLHEVGVPSRPLVKQVLDNGRTIVLSTLRAGELTTADSALGTGLNSALIFPLIIGGRVEAVLTIADVLSESFGSKEVTRMIELAAIISGKLSASRAQRQLEAIYDRDRDVTDLLMNLRGAVDIENISLMTAQILFRNLKSSMVRISFYEENGSFLTSNALCRRQTDKHVTPPKGHMILSLMPRHRQVRDDKETVLIDQGQPHRITDEIEISQAFMTGVRQAVLVPVLSGKNVKGVIGVAASGDSDSLTEEQIAWVEQVAMIMSSALVNLEQRVSQEIPAAMYSKNVTGEPELRGRVRSAITGILGTVELIKARGKPDESLNRQLELIDKSARGLNRFVADREEVVT